MQLSGAGLIPAHAGKTRDHRPGIQPGEAHPRSRGENAVGFADVAREAGSSPLTRGKLSDITYQAAKPRLIPAHAGKTTGFHCRPFSMPAHPRSRGENPPLRSPSTRAAGSSPLTRGKLLGLGADRDKVGLIPAHAGKTCSCSHRSARCAAHPRSRGENNARRGMKYRGAGSSPLTRGKPPLRLSIRALAGLIPAHAGKTL